MSLSSHPALPLVVFVAETCVVSLCTVRTILLTKGWKGLASFLGFFEVSIWLFAIGQVMRNLSSLDCSLAFAGGFCLGNYLGVIIEQKLAMGHVVVQVATRQASDGLVETLRSASYGVTCLNATGAMGPVQVFFTVVPRRELSHVLALIQRFDGRAFYSVHYLQAAAAGVFPVARRRVAQVLPASLRNVSGPAAGFDGSVASRHVPPKPRKSPTPAASAAG